MRHVDFASELDRKPRTVLKSLIIEAASSVAG